MRYKMAIFAVFMVLTGCGEHAAKGAAQGAGMGAVSGAVGSLVSAIIFGGDPAEAAARGAVYGGTVGAMSGAIGGSQVDSEIAKRRKIREDQIRAEIGEDAFRGLSALIACDLDDTLIYSAKSRRSINPNYSVAGYWLEVLAYADQGNIDMTNERLTEVVTNDWEMSNITDAEENLRELQRELLEIRKEYKLSEKCV